MRRSAVERLVLDAAALSGGVAFVAQWLIFESGNFSTTGGPVFIPFLGENGIYASRSLGSAWYAGVGLFFLGLVILAITRLLADPTN